MRPTTSLCLLAVVIAGCSSESGNTSSPGAESTAPGASNGSDHGATSDPSRVPSEPMGGAASSGGSSSGTGSDPGGFFAGGGSSSSGTGSVGGSTPSAEQSTGQDGGQAAELTAGAWDDVLNPGVFKSFVATFEQANNAPDTGGAVRIVITVQGDGGAPLSNAHVTVADSQKTYLSASTGTDGRLLLIPSRDGIPDGAQLTVSVDRPGQDPFTAPAPVGDAWTISVPGATTTLPAALDLAFVVDTTGSMGDELSYLQNEIDAIAADVKAKFANVDIRYGLVVYRDVVDIYVTRTFDFTGSLDTFNTNLRAQNADGGGDYPEEMEKGLHEMNGLSWRQGNVARISFLVADAPPHPEDVHVAFDEVDAARLHGIRLYSIAGSGAQTDAEFVLRSNAQLTGGRYFFLTDDSGIGDSHEIPHIPCYDVEHLRPLVARALASELSGTHVPAQPADVLRAVGNPQAGACAVGDASEAYAW